VETLTGIVSRRRNDENTLVITETDGVNQHWVSFARLTQLTAADVNDMGTLFNSLVDGSCEVHL
jgi:hypothetical protein